MKFGRFLENEAVPEWRSKYLNYRLLKAQLKEIPLNDSSCADIEDEFFNSARQELHKIKTFYMERETILVGKAVELFQEIKLFCSKMASEREIISDANNSNSNWSTNNTDNSNSNGLNINITEHKDGSSTFSYITSHLHIPPIKLHQRSFHVPQRTTHRLKLKKALLGLYTEIELLRSFRSLNSTAFSKIFKKFAKVTGSNDKAVSVLQDLRMDPFWKRTELDGLCSQVEDCFTQTFTSGDRHRAMTQLRLKDLKHESFHFASFASGVTWCASFIFIIITWFSSITPEHEYLFYLYSGLFTPILLAGLFSLNALVFKYTFINYRFIFQFNRRSTVHECQYSALIGTFASIYTLSSLMVMKMSSSDLIMRSKTIQFIPLLLVFLLSVLPGPVFWPQTRFWIFKTMFRIVSAPLFPVLFRDFFVNDQLISLTFFFQCLAWAFLARTDFPNTHWSISFAASIPYLWRVLQCLRRFYDTRLTLNLLNALKYGLSLISLSLRCFRSLSDFSVAADCLQLMATCLSLYWDVIMDFGLVQFEERKQRRSNNTSNHNLLHKRFPSKFLLRKQLLFPSKFIYYFAVLFDVITRFTWIVPLILRKSKLISWPHSNASLSVLCAFIEVFRRFNWTFFRLEYEQLNNCNAFRATDEWIVPVRTADLFYQDENKPEILKDDEIQTDVDFGEEEEEEDHEEENEYDDDHKERESGALLKT